MARVWQRSASGQHGSGYVTQEPMDMPIGRFANFVDPQGAPFSVMTLANAA